MSSNGAPVISNWTNSGSAGDELVVSGTNLGTGLTVLVSGVAPNGIAFQIQASVLSESDNGAVIQLPNSLPPDTIYQIVAENSQGTSAPFLVNAPQIWWVGPNEIQPGSVTSLFGQNLVLGPADHPIVTLEMTSGPHAGETFSLGVIDAQSNRVDVQIPTNLPQGTYSVQYNSGVGAGGAVATSQTLAPTIEVSAASGSNSHAVLNIANFGAIANDGHDDASAFDAAMSAANSLISAGSGITSVTVQLGSGEYDLSHSIALPDNIDLEGQGTSSTTLKATPGFHFTSGNDGILWTHASIEGTGPNLANVRIANLTIDTNGNSTSTATYDSSSYSSFLSAIDGRNTDHLTISNVQILAKGSTNAIDACDATHFTLENSTIVGPAIQLGAGSQISIHGNSFFGTDQSVANIFGLGASEVAIYGNTAQDLDPNATTGQAVLSDTYQGRLYYNLAYKGSQDVNQYIAQNHTIDIGPRVEAANLGVLENTGEQILFENSVVSPGITSQFSLGDGLFKSATPLSLTFNLSAPNITQAGNVGLLTVVSGTGAGETAQIDHYDPITGTYYFSDPLAVLPDATSVLLISQTPSHVAIVNNLLDGRTQDVSSSVFNSSTGVEVYPGGSHITIAGNTFSDLLTGVQLYGFDAPNSSSFIGSSYFNISGNSFTNVNVGVGSEVGHVNAGSLASDSVNAYKVTGTTIQHNNFSGVNNTAYEFGVVGSIDAAGFNVAGQNILPLTINAETVTLYGTVAPGSTVLVRDGAVQIGTTVANASGTWSFVTDTLASGVHVLTSTTMNSTGSISGTATPLIVIIPTNAPLVASFSPDSNVVGDGVTNVNHVTLSGTAAAGSTVQVFDGTALIGAATANAAGAWNFDTATLNDGVHSFTSKGVDAAGNLSAPSPALNVTVDTVAPVAPVIVSDAITNINQVILTGTAEANSTVKVFEGTTQLGATTADANGAWSLTTPALTAGAHNFNATATDAAGNTSASSEYLDPIIPPNAPKISSFSPDSNIFGDGVTNANHVTLSGVADPNTTVNIVDGTAQLGTAIVNGSGSWSFTTGLLADGTHNFTATDMDAQGDTSAPSTVLSVVVDTQGPAVTSRLAGDTGLSSTDNISSSSALSGTGDPNAVVTLKEGTTILGTTTADTSGRWAFSPVGLTDGAHTIVASETDAAGNTGSASLSFILDTKAPAVIEKLASDTGSSSTDKITSSSALSGTGDPNAVVTLKEGTTILGTTTTDTSGHWSYTPVGLTDGSHTIVASETDTAGNTGTTSLTFTLDTTVPVPTITNEVLGQGRVTLSGTAAEANDTISIYDGSTLLGTTKTGSNGAWTFLTSKVSDAVHIYTVNATDIAGNIGQSNNQAILGSSKANALVGTSGNDIIIGNGGNDTFTGGGGADVMTAGNGKDSFIFKAISDSTPASHDTIVNFNHVYDVINFTNIAGINATNGIASFQGQLSGSGNLTLNAHSIGYIEVGGNTEVLVNTTNSAEIVTSLDVHAANMEIVLAGTRLGLTSSDFHLI